MDAATTRTDKSLAVLQKLFGPLVHRHVWRCRLEKSTKAAAELLIAIPDEAVWRSEPLFSSWPGSSLQRLRDSATLIHREAGMTLALAQEPKAVSGVFWLLAGKVTQVPTKSEIRECALEMPFLKNRTTALTGPLVFPSLFAQAHGPGGVGPPLQRVALVPKAETVLDSIVTFSSGTLVDADALVLGSLRQRALRCQVSSTLLFIPCRVLDQELRTLRGSGLRAVRDAAKSALSSVVARRDDRPPLQAILSRNTLLGHLETAVLRRIHSQLEPSVFGAGDLVCSDVFTSETVYFLSHGQVVVRNERGEEVVQRHGGAAIGLHSFVPYEFPRYFEERRSVTARSYCEVWGISLVVLLRICEIRGRLTCAAQAAKRLQAEGSALAIASALRAAPCFSVVSDDTIANVIKALRVSIALPDDCLLSNRRPAKSGVIVVSGRAVLAEERDKGERIPVKCGTPMFFCESLAGVKPPQSIYAESSCIVLRGVPSSILNQLDSAGCPYEETHHILESSTHYVEHVYGRSHLERGQAQERAIERVREHDRKKRIEAKSVSGSSAHAGKGAIDTTEAKLELENHVMTSLALQIQSLHNDPLELARFKHLHGLDTDVAWKSDADVAVVPHSDAGRNVLVPSTGALSANGCFTLDDNGSLVHASCVPVVDACGASPSSRQHRRQEGYDVLSLAPRASPTETAEASAKQGTYSSVPAALTSHSTSVPPGIFHSLGHKKGVLRTRDLHVPLQGPRASSYTQERRRTPPPRLDALRKEAAALTDEAYGISGAPTQSRYVPRRL